jgi:hypothetical protein
MLWNLAFLKGHGVPCVSFSICLSLFVNLFLAFIKCRAMAIDMFRLTVVGTMSMALWCHVGNCTREDLGRTEKSR